MLDQVSRIIKDMPRRPAILAAAGVGLTAAVSGLSYLFFRNIATPARALTITRLPGVSLTGHFADLKVCFSSRPLDHVSLIPLRLRNMGTVPVQKNEIVSSIIFGSDPSVELLAAEVLHSSSPDLSASLEILPAGYHTRLHLEMIEPGAEITLGFLTAGGPDLHIYLSGGKLSDGGPITFVDQTLESEHEVLV